MKIFPSAALNLGPKPAKPRVRLKTGVRIWFRDANERGSRCWPGCPPCDGQCFSYRQVAENRVFDANATARYVVNGHDWKDAAGHARKLRWPPDGIPPAWREKPTDVAKPNIPQPQPIKKASK